VHNCRPMRQVKASVLRRLPLPYTATHYELDPFKKGYVSRDFVTRHNFVQKYLELTTHNVAYDETPYLITLSIGGRIPTDRFVRDAKGQWTHYDLITRNAAKLQYARSVDRS
jgi:hypothetical protein